MTDLQQLHAAAGWLRQQDSFTTDLARLRTDLRGSQEPFVWSIVGLAAIPVALPDRIRSGWIFLLRRDTPSGSHYHPNSVQHMVALNGSGRAHVGGVDRRMVPFGSAGHSIEEQWSVIGKGIPHEFFPEREDMAVLSFHTCAAEDLVEIATASGATRTYAPRER